MLDAADLMPSTPSRDWSILAAWLRAEWDDMRTRLEGFDVCPIAYNAGLKEAYSAIGRLVADCPPGEREARLYQILMETLGTPEEEEITGSR